MKCLKCNSENKNNAKFCSQCGASLLVPRGKTSGGSLVLHEDPAIDYWTPSWRWHLKTLVGISIFLCVLYFSLDKFLSHLPEPYGLRDIPKEITPWLSK
jgi:hypothetical protein